MPSPFARTALEYLGSTDIGRPLAIFFPNKTKAPLPAGYHGYDGKYTGAEEIAEWSHRWPTASIGLRLRPDVVGIDIDLYDGKRGAATIADLQGRWGKLPPTWKTTARRDGSGIWLYRVPLGAAAAMRDPERGAVEIVTYGQRFIACYPSVHPKVLKVYRWVDPAGFRHKEVLNLQRADLPMLPPDWIEGLASGSPTRMGKQRDLQGSPVDWLKARPEGSGKMCHGMKRDAGRYSAEVREAVSGSCYSTVIRGVTALVGNAGEGHRGGLTAIEKLFNAYVKTMKARDKGARSFAELSREFTKAVRGAIEKLPTYKISNEDDCELSASIRVQVAR